MDLQALQKEIIEKFQVIWTPPESNSMVGIHLEGFENEMPINGLRHKPMGAGNGWFLWSGNHEAPADVDFFIPIHVEHIYEKYPNIAKYLALPQGWRFQIDNQDYEDVWHDHSLD